jgi:molybdate transport system substrate-binding protein
MVVRVTLMDKWVLTCLVFVLILQATAGCGESQGKKLLVFAAASLAEPLSELGVKFSTANDVKINFSFDGSGSLAQSIRRGAPADVFISAGPVPMSLLDDEGKIAHTSRFVLVTNRLVLISPKNVANPLRSLGQLTTPAVRRIAIADPSLAPVGWYAKQALEGLGVWKELEPKIIPASSVRVGLAYVENGFVDAGIVYQTDAAWSEKVRTVSLLPEDSHSPIMYPAAVINTTEQNELAAQFLEFLRLDAAKRLFESHGFQSPIQERW